MDPAHLLPASEDAKFLKVPYEERWECLRHIIVPLYMDKYGPNGKSMTMAQVAGFMRDNYSFYAAETQYRRWFNKWGVRKRTLQGEKDDIVGALGRRKHPGTSTSNVTLGENKEVDKKQLKRYLKDQVRHHDREALVRSPGVLFSWNLPLAAYSKALGNQPNHPSPFTTSGATPTYMNVRSPEDTTPGRQPDPSPTMQLVRQKLAQDRSSLFLQGRAQQLLQSCAKEDRVTMASYLHDLYFYSFVKAKYWGKGPRTWTPGMISAFTHGSFDNPDTPSSLAGFPSSPIAIQGTAAEQISMSPPTQLCRWSIHLSRDHIYKEDPLQTSVTEPMDVDDSFDIRDPTSWREWPTNTPNPSFSESMAESIANSGFSSMRPEELPLSIQSISRSAQQDPCLLQVDSCKTAIIAGNEELLISLFEGWDDQLPDQLHEIYPFHLAATFLDGGHHCCNIFATLSDFLGSGYLFSRYVDNLGHTVLDALMVNILRSHSTLSPVLVSRQFEPPNRYPGEEKSVCGRWDADSPAVRELFARGYARIPTKWKHVFCHTSAQAICHAIIATLGCPAGPSVDSLSGLFLRRCTACGLELRLGPLHTLVVVAFYLAHQGMPGETMFGALAVLLCLLSLGANAGLTRVISVGEILGTVGSEDTCHHQPMDALELMLAVPEGLVSGWTDDCQTGWHCMLQVLRLAKEHRTNNPGQYDPEWYYPSQCGCGHAATGDDSDSDSDGRYKCGCRICSMEDRFEAHSGWVRLPCGSPKLGTLWATIQTELLTYRRLETGKPWISDKFSMDSLKEWLDGKTPDFRTRLVNDDGRSLMKSHSHCGWFTAADDFFCPVAGEVCTEHFMNMDKPYSRISFLQRPNFSHSWTNYSPADRR